MPKAQIQTEEFRKLLEERLGPLQERFERIHKHHAQESGALPADFAEQATELENAEVLEHLDASSRKDLEQIQAALHRIELGTYGVCLSCHKAIPKGRLLAVPTATRCLKCVEAKG